MHILLPVLWVLMVAAGAASIGVIWMGFCKGWKLAAGMVAVADTVQAMVTEEAAAMAQVAADVITAAVSGPAVFVYVQNAGLK